jgi:hypothetical protein
MLVVVEMLSKKLSEFGCFSDPALKMSTGAEMTHELKHEVGKDNVTVLPIQKKKSACG